MSNCDSRWPAPASLAPVIVLLWFTVAAAAPTESFSTKLYPVMDKAGCKNCHHADGVASATRLHFPPEGSSTQVIEAFGDSLVELVDRVSPEKSLLWNKPTNRIKHTGGERIKKGSAEEKLLLAWVNHLASLSGVQMRQALSFRVEELARAGKPPTVMLRRLTHRQYANTVRDLLGESSDPTTDFPPEDFVDGFKNQYGSQTLSPVQIEAYSRSAERLATRAFLRGDSRHLIPCAYSVTRVAPCRSEFVRVFGRRAFRRPLNATETAMYESIFLGQKDFIKGAQAVVESMLQAPSFLFWMEDSAKAEWKPYATASWLSYSLWNTMPDDELLRCAARGELSDSNAVDSVARRMLADPRSRPALDEFTAQWLRFDRAQTAAREKRSFPLFNPELVESMIEEARRFVGDLVWNDRNFMDVFRASYGFVNSDLAGVYKVPPPAHDYDRTEFPASQERAGVLGQALFLTLTSKTEDTTPTGRGLFAREQFLCQRVPPPPPGVDTNLPPVSENRPVTNRERLAAHTTDRACSGCHALIDPIGFGLEKFDAIGARREKAKLLFFPDIHEAKVASKQVELELDTTGQVAGIENSQFSNSRQLGEILAGSNQCQECMVKQVFRYLAGRHETAADVPRISQALAAFQKSGYHFQEILISLVKSSGSTRREGTSDGKRNYATR
jgi:Protein of unknown function (DUF1592)/Protein of unknown function (DUF1588)/Protein of unknown function (DUF1587)/Protein of unknown function (DUF1595)/Protein of unknown function (DUF1585)